MSLAVILGSGVLALLCFYFAFEVDEKHFLLKLLFIFFALIFMFMIAVGTAQQTAQECSVEVINQTVNGSTTTFVNDYLCYNTGKSSSNLIVLSGALFTLFAIYITVYILKEVFDARNFKLGRK